MNHLRHNTYVLLAATLIALVTVIFYTNRVEASPAAPVEIQLTQPDGSSFIARQWGDEWNHGLETGDGYSILQAADGWWVYADQGPDGTLLPAGQAGAPLRVGIDPPGALAQHLRPADLELNPHAPSALFAGGIAAPEYQNTGSQPTVVLLVEYSNIPSTYTYSNFQSLFFNPAPGSVYHYYPITSYGQLYLIPAVETEGTGGDGVIGWLNLGATHPAADGVLTNNEMRQIAKDAVNAADAYIDYNAFDIAPNDGYLQQWELHIFVVVAGYESSYDGTTTNAVWAHNWSLDGIGAPTHDTVVIGDGNHYGAYSEAGELHGTHMATMGVMAHELGHDLSNPDLYDTDGSSEGVGQWSLMSTGSWNQVGTWAGDSPAHLDAFLKSYQGWVTPTDVIGTLADKLIVEAESNPVAFRLGANPGLVDWEWYVTSGVGEYFLVENRQMIGYDTGLPGCGLLIWHIDESVSNMNDANANEDHPLVWLEQADGMNHLHHPYGVTTGGNTGNNNDPYPGATVGNFDFNPFTNPGTTLYGGRRSYASVHVDSLGCGSTMQADLAYQPAAAYLPMILKSGGTSALAGFNKSSPALAAFNRPAGLTLDWQDLAIASTYQYCLDTTNDGTCAGGAWLPSGTASQVALVGLINGTTYYWQARAITPAGTVEADNGTWWSFHVIPLPGAFSKSTPSNGAGGQVLTNLLLSWTGSTNTTGYEYCIDTVSNATCDAPAAWTSTGIYWGTYLSGLTPNTTYYWQARATGPGGTVYANGGTWWSFTTGSAFTTIMSEDFEGTFPSGSWSASDLNGIGNGEYYPAKRTCKPYAGANSAWMIGGGSSGGSLGCSTSQQYFDAHFAWMQYGPFSLSGATKAEVVYKAWINTDGDPGANDSLWHGAWDGTNSPLGVSNTGSGSWQSYSFDLSNNYCGNGSSSCLGLSNVYIFFEFYSDSDGYLDYEGAFVDNILLRVCTAATCVASPPAFPLEDALELFRLPDLLAPLIEEVLTPLPVPMPF